MLELLFLSLVCMDGVTLGQEKLLDTASHIGVDPMVCGTHPYVRGREYTPHVSNNFSCPRVTPSMHTGERKKSSNIKTHHKFHSKSMIIM